MAWNEPGNNNQDPWGGGNRGGDGPPDLDEAFKKLQDKMNNMFGSNQGDNNGGGGGGNFSLVFLGVGFIAVAVIWFFMGLYTIDQQERAVVLRLGVYKETVSPGLHWNPPLIDSIYQENVTRVRSYVHRAQMLTKDENIVEISLSVQYNVADLPNYILKVRQPENSLAQATESALRHAVGSAEMHQVLTEGREQLAIDVQQRLQDLMDNYQTGILVTEVNVENTQPPQEVQASFDDVTKAKEDEERAKNEAESYANGIIPEARGRAQRQLEEAMAYKEQVIARAEGEAQRFDKLLVEYHKSPEVMRDRLYLDTMEQVLGNSSKVLIDVEGGNNLMYLPLDKLMQSSGSSSDVGTPELSTTNVRQLTDRVVDQLRRDTQSSRRREVR